MEDISIRQASLHDLETLLLFEQGVISTERPFDPTLKQKDTRYYDLEAMIAAPHIELLVAESGGRVVASGYARIEEAKPYLQHTQHAYLGFMYVDPAYRGKGINKMIMDALKNWSLSNNITELRLDVYTENAAAIKAYEKFGFVKHMVEMRKPIKKMQPLLFYMLLFFLLACKNRSYTDKVDEKSELLSLEYKWLEAEFSLDTAYLSSIIDSSFIAVSEGKIHNKQEDILDMYTNISQRIKDSIFIDSFKLENTLVNLYGNTAVVTFVVHTNGSNKTMPTERWTRFYDVWVKRDGKWKAVASQGSKVE
ncbi:MAG: GNAT family N-acetyltransferase [Chitinophagaceae bacterium]